MRIIKNLKHNLKNTVIALGNFDGVHVGHKKILTECVKYAKKSKKTSIALTFDPHPQHVVAPKRGLRLLTTLGEREEYIKDTGINCLLIIKFGQKLRKLSYEKFVKKYLVEKLGASMVFVGYDYAFGKKRQGDVRHLKALGKKYGFKVCVVKPVSLKGKIVKSKIIRELLSSGEFKKATSLLSHPYVISGKVIKGVGRGKELGFPTANLALDQQKLIPLPGVYYGKVKLGSKTHKCLINIGLRPTFPGDGGAVEVYILKFNKNIRGKKLKVSLLQRFRDELQFSDVIELKVQIKKDLIRAIMA